MPDTPAPADDITLPAMPESPTHGMNLGERIAHVGGRTNAHGYIEFGSVMAVDALIKHVLRDVPTTQVEGVQARYRIPDGEWSSWGHVVCGVKGHEQELRVAPDRDSPSRAAVPTPRDEDQRTRGHMGSTPDGGIDDHDEPNLPESLTLEVDAWFARNTGLGGCSDKDAAELAAIFYDVTYEGGRESVEDALSVVESFGPSVQGLNDTFARQVLLAAEVRRLQSLYEMAAKGRSEFRAAFSGLRSAANAALAMCERIVDQYDRVQFGVDFGALGGSLRKALGSTVPAAVDVGAAQAETAQAAPVGCQCPACTPVLHASDCAVHNAPAMPVGPCNCGAAPGMVLRPAKATKEMMVAAVKFANGDAVYKVVAAGALEIEEQIYGEIWETMLAAATTGATLPAEGSKS